MAESYSLDETVKEIKRRREAEKKQLEQLDASRYNELDEMSRELNEYGDSKNIRNIFRK